MKKIFRFTFFIVLLIGYGNIQAQSTGTTTTIILLRHCEKDTPGGKDPQLSAAGRSRAERLPKLFKDVKPDLLYSTPYIRTRQTLMPWAKQLNTEIKAYDPADLASFAKELLAMKGKTIVVSGHSNTTPSMVNLLIGSNKYPSLNDNEYSKLWVVIIKGGQASEKMMEY